MAAKFSVRRVLLVVGAVLLLPLVLVVAALLIAESEWGERWVEARMGAALNREVQIEGVDVQLRWPLRLTFERLRVSNPAWAKTPNLVDATGVDARLDVLPLFRRQFVFPFFGARQAAAGLELDGARATWRFGREEQGPSRIRLERVFLADGDVVYRDELQKTALDIKAKGSLGETGELHLTASGQFRGQVSQGEARIPALQPTRGIPIPIVLKAAVGRTSIEGDGSFAPNFGTADMKFKLAGQTLKDLRQVFGMNLPDTPPYRLAGRLRRDGREWVFDPFDGRVGDSDLRGNVTYRTGGTRPFFLANLESKLLDFDDLGPIIGAPPKTGPGETASPEQRRQAAQLAASAHVLPHARFSAERWDEMDADVRLVALRVLRPKQLPLDTLSTHLVLKDSVMRLAPLDFGVAGGRVSTHITLDGRARPARGDMQVDVQGLQLAQLFPTVKTMQESLGTLYGRGRLAGRGESVADLLGTGDGRLSLAVDGGRVSLLLVELLGLDLWEAAGLLGTRNKQVELRCAAGQFEVKDGVAKSESFVVDTSDTVVKVEGSVNLRDEQLDFVSHPRPKDKSLFALRSPMVMKGSLKDPSVHPKPGPIVARVVAAAALSAAYPPLAIAPFIETGPGKDADCATLLAQAKAKGAVRKEPAKPAA